MKKFKIMKKLRFVTVKNILVLSVLLFQLSNVFAQDKDSYLEIRGTAEKNKGQVNGAVVNLYNGKTKVKSYTTGPDGIFNFKLELNKDYTVEVTKNGFITKKINFNTEVPDDVTGVFISEFAMGLYETCDGVDVSAFDAPVDMITFNKKQKQFESDKSYVSKMQAKYARLYMQLDECQMEKLRATLDEADQLYKKQDYEAAKEKYEEALDMSPEDRQIQKSLDDINNRLGKDEKIDELYKQTLAQADALLSQGKLDEAKQMYADASKLKPQEQYPKQKVNEIESQLATADAAQQQKLAADTKYNGLIAQANAAYTSKNYEQAKQFYQMAANVKPGETFTGSKIQELNTLIAQQTQQQEKQKTIDKAFNMSIEQANQYYANKQYAQAKEAYTKAMSLKPQESSPMQKIAEIDNLMEAQQKAGMQKKKEALEQAYDQAVEQGDNFFKAKDYESAKQAYQKAQEQKPNDGYVRQRIDRINGILATESANKQRELETNYKNAMTAGETFIEKKQYDLAKAEFQKALDYKPGDAPAQQNITRVNGLIEQQQNNLSALNSKKKQYNELISKADGLFQLKEYDAARQTYNQASQVLSSESYPAQQIQEIDRLVSAEKTRKQQEIESNYKNAMLAGNNSLQKKDYTKAISSFQEALNYKPNDPAATNKISESNALIRQEQGKLAAEKAKREQYNNAVGQGDGYMNQKNYTAARSAYLSASQIFPSETYPQNKITEIDKILAEQQQKAAQQAALESSYKLALSKADGLYQQKEYALAKTAYNNALSIKPDESYPKNQIAEIDRIVKAQLQAQADLKAKEDAYKKAVDAGDQFYSQKNYDQAKTSYNQALGLKPGEAYPTGQISKIDELLSSLEKQKQENAAKNQAYDAAIASADKAFDEADYSTAKTDYQKALVIKPEEKYPKSKIARIDEINRMLAQQKTAAVVKSDKSNAAESSKLADLKFSNNDERDRYLNKLRKQYPEGITLEIYKEKNRTISRYIVIRGDQANDFREFRYSWGVQYTQNGKQVSQLFFTQQTKRRAGEPYTEKKM